MTDLREDGVTNPEPVSSFQCDRCNKQQSEYADDDGGYLRITVGQYYKNGPYPLPAPISSPPHHEERSRHAILPDEERRPIAAISALH